MSSIPPQRGGQSILARQPMNGRAAELSRHLVEAQEEERKRISRELHDEAGQGLMALRLYLGMIASESKHAETTSAIEEATSMLDRTIGELRRIIARLSPRTLNELGLLAAIRKEARSLSKITAMKGFLDLPPHLPNVTHETEIVLYRAVQEALHNIAKHSQAENFTIRLECQDRLFLLRIEDDGVGFSAKPNSQGSFGLLGMRERIAAMGGTVRIRTRRGRGTKIRVMLPLIAGEKQPARQNDEASLHHNGVREGGAKRRRETVFRGLVKSPPGFMHGHQVHSS
ncbi:MAG TPA: sensor histidine kinase [Terriglobales bacterium]|nr:sensor histidine kinase [Terriglobales bacterium]